MRKYKIIMSTLFAPTLVSVFSFSASCSGKKDNSIFSFKWDYKKDGWYTSKIKPKQTSSPLTNEQASNLYFDEVLRDKKFEIFADDFTLYCSNEWKPDLWKLGLSDDVPEYKSASVETKIYESNFEKHKISFDLKYKVIIQGLSGDGTDIIEQEDSFSLAIRNLKYKMSFKNDMWTFDHDCYDDSFKWHTDYLANDKEWSIKGSGISGFYKFSFDFNYENYNQMILAGELPGTTGFASNYFKNIQHQQ